MAAATRTVMRREADRLQRAHGDGRFHRRRSGMDADTTRSLTDAAVLAARGGDEDGLRFLYLRYADGVYSYVRSIVHNEHDAEDITQAVFAKLPTRLKHYRRQTAPFASWILRVAHNAAIDQMRSQRAIPSETVLDTEAADNTGAERLEALRVALSRIPEGQREILLMRFVAGLSPSEVAERTGRTEAAVHALQHRARRDLRENLEALGAAPSARAPREA
jgi:RNA polymerase sigma-70 factor (ECF subfamily)